MRIYVYTALIALYIVSQFISEPIINYSIGMIAAAALVISAFYAKGVYFISGAIFLVVGTILFIYNKLPWYTFILHFEQVLGLLSLFFVLPFMNSLIRVGRYDQNLSLWLQHKMTDMGTLYRRSFSVCHLLGLFLNIATVPLLVKSLHAALRELPKHIANKFYTQNLLRAYALCLTWSPMEVMISTTIDMTNVKYYIILPILLFIVMIMVIVEWFFTSYKYRHLSVSQVDLQTEHSKQLYQKVIQLIAMLVVFIFAVSSIQHLFHKGFLFSVVILLVPVSLLWAMLIRRTKRYIVIATQHWKERTKGLANYFFMFLSAGLFVEMLSRSRLQTVLEAMFQLGTKQTLWLYAMIGIYFLVTSFIGFHPLVGLTLLASLLQPILPTIPAVPLSIVLICCSLSTVMYSPYNISVSILAEELKTNPYRIGVWNIWFALGYMAVSIFVAFFIEKIFWY
ncbi:hypothetical protein B0I26_10211 [Anoxybacillus vitaminiphilus]|uniref:Uncharacterized protein n=1 Tax=Paranoxybacillus vitaminiphilus TaxID=581036 RepID=A0A327YM24_9BACL|nr:hypothetical protein [Anoxybacillus vitaminiphilus]RAK22033.1 hypothetical protein B0I26_10211 [Anoxybacillus vitaminiphilus]